MTLSVRLEPELQNRLNHLAEQTGRAKSFYIKEALTKYLDEAEDVYLATAVIERIKLGKENVRPMDEVLDELEQ